MNLNQDELLITETKSNTWLFKSKTLKAYGSNHKTVLREDQIWDLTSQCAVFFIHCSSHEFTHNELQNSPNYYHKQNY